MLIVERVSLVPAHKEVTAEHNLSLGGTNGKRQMLGGSNKRQAYIGRDSWR
jgi:hypothetical protein